MSTIVIPSRPTPNGPLHLGHIAGPYLRADITKRYLEETGERAFLVSMPDIYDNWILQTLECGNDIDFIEHHIQSIRDGFAKFDIQFDCFGDPFGTQETVLMNDTLEMCIQAVGSETFIWPYHHSDEKFLFGTELGTICSECKQTISGMICEDCCQLTMPTESAVGAVTLQSYQTPFVSISDDQRQDAERSVSQIYPMGVAELAARLAPRNHAHQFPLFLKVSKRSKSALPILESFDCIPFTLSTHLIYKSVLCEIIHQTFNEMPDTSIAFIGRDGIFGHLILSQSLANVSGLKNYDHIVVNNFLHLDGKKFSTSQSHAIWAQDIAGLIDGADVNFWRLYLAAIDVTTQAPNFCLSDALSAYRHWYRPFQQKGSDLKGDRRKQGPFLADGVLRGEFEKAELEIKKAMNSGRFNVHQFAQSIINLFQMYKDLEPHHIHFLTDQIVRLSRPIITNKLGEMGS